MWLYSYRNIRVFEREKIFKQNEKNNFLNSIKTISSDIINDFNKLNKSNFLNKYGHLRPNSYEIESPNYDQAYEKYFKFDKKKIIKKKIPVLLKQKIQIKKFIRKN